MDHKPQGKSIIIHSESDQTDSSTLETIEEHHEPKGSPDPPSGVDKGGSSEQPPGIRFISDITSKMTGKVSHADIETDLVNDEGESRKRSKTSLSERFNFLGLSGKRASSSTSAILKSNSVIDSRARSHTVMSKLSSPNTPKLEESPCNVGTAPGSHQRQATTTTHVLQNVSIFKQDSQGDQIDKFTIQVTQDPIEEEEDDIMDSQQTLDGNRPERHLKSYSAMDEMLSYDSLSGKNEGRKRQKTENDIHRRRFDIPQISPARLNDKRSRSITTFRPTAALDKRKSSAKTNSDPTCCCFHIPHKWMSLGNVVSFFNAIILIVAILLVSLVAYFSGVNSTQNAVGALSSVLINGISVKLDQMFESAESFNIFSESVFTKPLYPPSNSVRAMDHLYFFMSQIDGQFDQVYVATPDSMFAGVGVLRYYNGTIVPGKFAIKYENRTTKPYRLVYRVDDNCSQYDFDTCIAPAFGPYRKPIQNATYTVWDKPFFRQAAALQRVGWSPIYKYADSRVLGITTFRPVYNTLDKLTMIAAVDITLDQISAYLQKVAKLTNIQNTEGMVLFIIEPRTGYLVATSEPNLVDVTDTLNNRIDGLSCGYDVISESLKDIVGANNSFESVSWPENGNVVTFKTSNAQLIVNRYQRRDGDIDWILIAHIPYSSFTRGLLNAFIYQVPIAALIVLIISIICSIFVTRTIGRPLNKIARQLLSLADLSFDGEDPDDFEILKSGSNLPISKKKKKPQNKMRLKEIQYLESAMSAMKTGLKSFSKYVPLDVVTLLVKMKREAVLGVDEMEISIFFSDIVNFTTMAECLTPKQLVELMSEYLSEMSNIILQNYGVVDKYIGDAVMAFWNAPISVDDHATIACSSALKCQQKLFELRKKWCQQGFPEIHARIGVNTGLALVGNLGSKSRLNYTCLGDNVNLASRLESLNKKYETSILISEYTWQLCKKDQFLARSVDIVTVKGKSKPVRVYELLGFRKYMHPDKLTAFNIYERAFEEYVAGNFWAAMEGFQKFLKSPGADAQDHLAHKHYLKCQEMISSPHFSKESWNPTCVLDEK